MHKIEQDTLDRDWDMVSGKMKDALIVMLLLCILSILAYYNLGWTDDTYEQDNSRIVKFEEYLGMHEFGVYYFRVDENMTWKDIRERYWSYRSYPLANAILNGYFNDFCGDESR